MLRLLLLLAAQTQALRAPPTRPLRITHVHRAVTAPTTDAATNRVALTFPVLTVAAAALGRAAPQSVAATLGTKAAFRRGLALHALGRYREALPELGKARDLEPKNAQVADAIRFAEMRLSRGA